MMVQKLFIFILCMFRVTYYNLSFFQIFKKLMFLVCLSKIVIMLSKYHAAEIDKDKVFP